MSDLVTMRVNIADDIKRSDLNDQIDRFINKAITHYENENFWFKETTATFSTVADQQIYTSSDSGFPTTIADVDYVEISINATTQYELTPTTFSDIQRKDPGNAVFTGYPTEYAIYDENMYLYPTPNSAYGVTMYYETTFTTLSSDNATNAFITEATDLIEARAAYYLCARTLMDTERAAVYKMQEIDALKALRQRSNTLNSTGRLKRKVF